MVCQVVWKMNEIIKQFNKSLNNKIQCCNKFSDGLSILPKSYALNKNYVQNNKIYLSYLVFDIDYPITMMKIAKDGLPIPTIFIGNKQSGRAHILYKLKSPVINTDNARKKPIKLFEEVYRGLGEVLEADPDYSMHLVKNPNKDKLYNVDTENIEYELKDLASEWLPKYIGKTITNKNRGWQLVSPNLLGRNSTLFDSLRFHAYRIVHYHQSQLDFKLELALRADAINLELANQFSSRLDRKEVRTIINSVAKWTWANKEKFDNFKDRGACQLGDNRFTNPDMPPLPLEDVKKRQRIGAKYSAELKSTRTIEKIEQAIYELIRHGKKATQLEIANHSGLGFATVQRYWKLIKY